MPHVCILNSQAWQIRFTIGTYGGNILYHRSIDVTQTYGWEIRFTIGLYPELISMVESMARKYGT